MRCCNVAINKELAIFEMSCDVHIHIYLTKCTASLEGECWIFMSLPCLSFIHFLSWTLTLQHIDYLMFVLHNIDYVSQTFSLVVSTFVLKLRHE